MVKTLSREDIQRMIRRNGSAGSNVGSGGGGGITLAQVDAGYVSKAFFNQLFTIHGKRTYTDQETEEEVTEDVIISPNQIVSGEYSLSNVEVSVGLWTNSFLSALGIGSGGGGGGTTALTDLVDVNPNMVPTNNQVLTYDATLGKWTAKDAQGGGGADMQTVWAALAQNTSEQINASHMTNALGGYLPLTGGNLTGNISWHTNSGGTDIGTSTIGAGDNDSGGNAYIGTTNRANLAIGSWNGISFWNRSQSGSYPLMTTGNFNARTGVWNVVGGYQVNGNSVATEQWVNNQGFLKTEAHLGTVTSVAMTAPTGFSVTGSPITSSGTIALNFASGYSLPTTAKQSNWDTAYGWGNHAEAGYIKTATGTFWGQSWSNGGTVSGNMTNVGTMTFKANNFALSTNFTDQWSDGTNDHPWYGYDHRYPNTGVFSTTISDYHGLTLRTASGYLCMQSGGNVGIGTTTPGSKLDVAGSIRASIDMTAQSIELIASSPFIDFHYGSSSSDYTSRIIADASGVLRVQSMSASAGFKVGEYYNGSYIQVGNIQIVYDSTYNALKVIKNDGTAANFYATGGVSALGFSNGSPMSLGGLSDVTISSPTDRQILYYNGSSNKWNNSTCLTANDAVSNPFFGFSHTYNGTTSQWYLQAYLGNFAFGPTYNNALKLNSSGHVSIGSGATPQSSYDLYIANSASASSFVNRSDMRLKEVRNDVNMTVHQVADAPAFTFLWKNCDDNALHVGTSAQYWQSILPECVMTDNDGMLSMDYGAAAIASVVALAKVVESHEDRLRRIEEMLK